MLRIADQMPAVALVVVVLSGAALVVAGLRQRAADGAQGRLRPPLPLADQQRIVTLAAACLAAGGARVQAVRAVREVVRVRLTDAVQLVDAISAAHPAGGPGATGDEDALDG